MKKLLLSTLAALAFLTGCGKDGGVNSAAMNEPLNGKISDRAWKVQFGTVRKQMLSGSYSFTLWDLAPGQDPCSATYHVGETVYFVSFNLKDISVGEYNAKAGSGTPVYLTKAATTAGNLSSDSSGAFGDARITSANSSTVEGQLDVRANDGNWVKGKFTAKVCN